jgi:hypothetical protein
MFMKCLVQLIVSLPAADHTSGVTETPAIIPFLQDLLQRDEGVAPSET